jgi:curved DNA-binding protein CbpA
MINYYATLGVLPTSSTDEIRASFRQLVKRYHPDMRSGNAAIFARVREAYEILSEPETREQFDAAWKQATTPRAQIGSDFTYRGNNASPDQPVTVLTRVMSLALPRSGSLAGSRSNRPPPKPCGRRRSASSKVPIPRSLPST